MLFIQFIIVLVVLCCVFISATPNNKNLRNKEAAVLHKEEASAASAAAAAPAAVATAAATAVKIDLKTFNKNLRKHLKTKGHKFGNDHAFIEGLNKATVNKRAKKDVEAHKRLVEMTNDHRALQNTDNTYIGGFVPSRDLPPRISLMEQDGYLEQKMYSDPNCHADTVTGIYAFRTGHCINEDNYDNRVKTGYIYRQDEDFYALVSETRFYDNRCTSRNTMYPSEVTGYAPLNECLTVMGEGFMGTQYVTMNRVMTDAPTTVTGAGLIFHYFPTQTTCMKNNKAYITDYAFSSATVMSAMCEYIGDGKSGRITCASGEVRMEVFNNVYCEGFPSSYIEHSAFAQSGCEYHGSSDDQPSRMICDGNWSPRYNPPMFSGPSM